MNTPPFKVNPTGFVKGQIIALKARAKQHNLLSTLMQDLLDVVSALEQQPLTWAQLQIHQTNPDFTECFRFFRYFSIRYLVYENQSVVELLNLEVIPGHPLTAPTN